MLKNARPPAAHPAQLCLLDNHAKVDRTAFGRLQAQISPGKENHLDRVAQLARLLRGQPPMELKGDQSLVNTGPARASAQVMLTGSQHDLRSSELLVVVERHAP